MRKDVKDTKHAGTNLKPDETEIGGVIVPGPGRKEHWIRTGQPEANDEDGKGNRPHLDEMTNA